MSARSWRRSISSKIAFVSLAFALIFSMLSLPAYASERPEKISCKGTESSATQMIGLATAQIISFIVNDQAYGIGFSNLKISDYCGVYDAAPHGICIEGNILEGDEIRYTVDGVDTDNVFCDAGTYSVDVTITRNGRSATRTGSVQIAQAPLVVTTESATKTFDGQPLTAGGNVDGLVGGETLAFRTTGYQTWCGSSRNNYELIWNGTANPNNYYIHSEDLGNLTVSLLAIESDVPKDPVETGRPIEQPTFDGEDPVSTPTVTPDPTPDLTSTSGQKIPGVQILTESKNNISRPKITPKRIQNVASQTSSENASEATPVETVPVEAVQDQDVVSATTEAVAEHIDEDEAPLASGILSGESLPGSEGIKGFWSLSSETVAMLALFLSAVVLIALSTVFFMRHKKD